MAQGNLTGPLLGYRAPANAKSFRLICILSVIAVLTVIGIAAIGLLLSYNSGVNSALRAVGEGKRSGNEYGIVESEYGVVAADDGWCSNVGVSVLKERGHAVDAAVATALCLGIVHPMSSGIGGGSFMIVRSAATLKAQAFDSRETAPLAASKNMYSKNPEAKSSGALSMGVPGEIAGLHAAWLEHGRLPWKTLFQPAIKLAKDGFVVPPYLAMELASSEKKILADPGLRSVFAPTGKLLETGDTCYNSELARTLELISEEGPQALYNGSIGEKLVRDVEEAGGILTMDDLRRYRVEVKEAMSVDVMGFTVLGMPPPSSGTLGLSLVLNILESYGPSDDAAKSSLGVHRLIEAMKHMFAIRMNLGDPDFVNITKYEAAMLSKSYANKIRQKIFDSTTFGPSYYLPKWNQLDDHGTSHFCIVDADRNALSMTTTVNYYFGAGVLSPSTGIILNNEMDDFSTPTEISPDTLPPAPANFIEPGKRPLSSMTPIIILKNNQLAGLIGGSGGLKIIPGVIQVLLNHFIFGMEPLAAVQQPRVYHKLIPNVVTYENWTLIDGDHIEISEKTKLFLKERGHILNAQASGAVCQLVIQNLQNPIKIEREGEPSNQVIYGLLTAVSDPRKDGRPAGI